MALSPTFSEVLLASRRHAGRLWRCCPAVAEQRALLDQLSGSYLRRGEQVAVLCSPEAVLSNLSVLENILLPATWHGAPPQLAEAVSEFLVRHHLDPDRFLLQRAAGLGSAERELVGVARAVQMAATVVLVEDDQERRAEWLEERLHKLAVALPAVRIEVISTREMPAGFSGVKAAAAVDLS